MSKTANDFNVAPKAVATAPQGHRQPVEEALRIRSKLEDAADENRKENARHLTEQLSRAKHRTA